MARPTARGTALLAVAVGAYLAARIVGTWELYFLAFAFLAAVGVAWVLVLATGRHLQVVRSVTPVSVVHVADGSAVSAAEDLSLRRALAAAGVHYLTMGLGDDLGAALSIRAEGRRARAR